MNLRRIGIAVFAAAIFAAVPARAQDAPSDAPPPPLAPPAAPEYTAPLYQRTQPTYVPQSVAMSGPRMITDWEEGQAIPPGYHVTTHIRKGLVIAGSVVFGTMWLISSLVAAVSSDANQGRSNPDGALWVPGIGPFVQMANTSSATGNFVLVIDGVAQTGGLTMLIVGLTSPKTVLVRNDLGLHVQPTPMALGRNGGGFGLVGSF